MTISYITAVGTEIFDTTRDRDVICEQTKIDVLPQQIDLPDKFISQHHWVWTMFTMQHINCTILAVFLIQKEKIFSSSQKLSSLSCVRFNTSCYGRVYLSLTFCLLRATTSQSLSSYNLSLSLELCPLQYFIVRQYLRLYNPLSIESKYYSRDNLCFFHLSTYGKSFL
jgi:hypothetical protein